VLNYGAIISIKTIASEVINQQPVIHFNAFSFKREAIKTNEMKLPQHLSAARRTDLSRDLPRGYIYLATDQLDKC
jgi:hypothetical protein